MQAGPKCLQIAKHYEQGPKGGFAAKRYLCPAKKWTLGWGHVILPNEQFNEPIDEATANFVLAADLNAKAKQLDRLIKRPTTQEQYDAMLSLAFNAGVGKADGIKGDFADSSLLDYHNRGMFQLAAAEFPHWCHSGGKILDGLVKRRKTEAGVYLGGPVIFY